MKSLLKRIFPFVISFIIGILFVPFSVSKDNFSLKSEKTSNIETQNLFFNSPKQFKSKNKQRRCELFGHTDFKKYKNFNIEMLKNELEKTISTNADKYLMFVGEKSNLTPKEWEYNQELQKLLKRKLILLQFLIKKEGKFGMRDKGAFFETCYEF